MKNIFTVTGLILLSLNAFAGDKGNGGTVLDCGDRVVLADFEEVKIRVGLRGKIEILESEDSVEVQIADAVSRIEKLNQEVAKDLNKAINDFQNEVYHIEDDYEWTITPDIGPFPLPNGCTPKNTVIYVDNGGPIEMNMKLYNRLSNTHKAGIILHEAIYKLMRERGTDGTAVPARRLTAMLFAVKPDLEILKSLVTRFLAPKTNQKTIFFTKDVYERNNLNYTFIVKTLQGKYGYTSISKVNSYSISSEGFLNVKVPIETLVAGDFITLKFAAFSYGGQENAKVSISLAQNNDPKPKKTRAKYQTVIKTEEINFIIKYNRTEVNTFLGILSPKMDEYLKGKLN